MATRAITALKQVKGRSIPIWEWQALQDFALAGDRAQLAALVYGGHAKAAVALHAAAHQQPITWLKDVEFHLLSCMSLVLVSLH